MVGYKRYNFRINSDHIISKKFSFGQNLFFAYGNQAYDNNETGSRTNLVNVMWIMPYMPVHDPYHGWIQGCQYGIGRRRSDQSG